MSHDDLIQSGGPCQALPCIHTVETGKHEWNGLHSIHQAHDRFWFKRCPTCGWIDTEDFAAEVERATIERCAQIADSFDPQHAGGMCSPMAALIAAQIREGQ